MAKEKKELADILRIEGVRAKGYGTIPKAAMIDYDISFTARTVYAYFRSLSGRGEIVFPGRDKILRDIRISKEAYYKALAELIEAGYLEVKQERSIAAGNKFMRNVYTIVSRPQKYKNPPADNPAKARMYRKIMQNGLDSLGYGIIPYAVMSDPRMKFQPKGVYAYISPFVGLDNTAELDAKKIAYHLGFNDPHTLPANMKILKDLNYIKVTRLYENGRLTSKNRYSLVQTPTPLLNVEKQDTELLNAEKQDTELLNVEKQDTELLNAEKQDTELLNVKKQDTELLNVKKQDTELLDAEKQDAEKQDAEKQDTISTSPTITSFTNTSPTITSIVMDRLITRVRNQIDYSLMCFAYGATDTEKQALDNLIQVVAETLALPDPRIIIAGEPLVTQHVRDVLLTINNEAACRVLERFLARVTSIDAANHKRYLLTSIYRELRFPQNCDCDDYDDLSAQVGS